MTGSGKQRLYRLAGIVSLLILLCAAWLMLQLTLPYTALRPGIDFLKTKAFIYHIRHWRLSFYIHVFTGLIALMAGLVQFNGFIINRYPNLHRTIGYVYVCNVLLITGPAALVMSFYANGGWPARTSFILQSLCWICCTAMGLLKVRQRKFEAHGAWLIRSYALTLAAVTLRAYAAILSISGSNLRPTDKYVLIAWLSWIPNLLVAECLICMGLVRHIINNSRNGRLNVQ